MTSRRRVAAVGQRYRPQPDPAIPNSRLGLLPFCVPVFLAVVVLPWALLLTLGAALIIRPRLGASITTSSSPTPSDFVTVLDADDSTMAIVGPAISCRKPARPRHRSVG